MYLSTCFPAKGTCLEQQEQTGKTEPKLGERVGPQATPTSPPDQPRPCPGLSKPPPMRWKEWATARQWHLPDIPSCPSFFCTACIYPHLSRATLPSLPDSLTSFSLAWHAWPFRHRNETNGPSGADSQHARLLPRQTTTGVRSTHQAGRLRRPAMSRAISCRLPMGRCLPTNGSNAGDQEANHGPLTAYALCSLCVSVHMPIGPTRRTSSSAHHHFKLTPAWVRRSGALVDCRSMPLGLSGRPSVLPPDVALLPAYHALEAPHI